MSIYLHWIIVGVLVIGSFVLGLFTETSGILVSPMPAVEVDK